MLSLNVNYMRSRFLPNIIISSLITIAIWLWSSPAWALIQIKLNDINYKSCPTELGKGSITSGSSMAAILVLCTIPSNFNNMEQAVSVI